MRFDFLLYIGIALVFILAILLLVFFLSSKRKKVSPPSKESPKQTTPKEQDFNSLALIIEEKSSTAQELQDALDLILQNHGRIDNFTEYQEVLTKLTKHPNTNKHLILNFDKALSKLNPKYKKDISKSVTDALNT